MKVEEKKVMESVIRYFDEVIMPPLNREFGELLGDMAILVLGSAGLGIADEWSDLEAAVYLPDPLWRAKGASLQLALNQCIAQQNPWKKEGSILSVHPFSWFLDGQGAKLLEREKDSGSLPPNRGKSEEAARILWEDISVETLFTIRKNLIYYDPKNQLRQVRELTAPEKYPECLWKKSLLAKLKDFLENLHDLRQDIRRQRFAEAQIHLGSAVQNLFHAGFLAVHCYYPWHTHLRWAWEALKSPLFELGANFDRLAHAEWTEKLSIMEGIFDALRKYIAESGVLPEVNLYCDDLEQELLWAERLGAWENPDWRDFVRDKMKKAKAAGYPAEQFWVWSLWGL